MSESCERLQLCLWPHLGMTIEDGEMTFDHEAQRRFMSLVEARIAEVLAVDDKAHSNSGFLLHSVARHLCVTPNAKRIRPLLTYWFGLALESDTDKLVDAAVACELIHSASLLHDDVVDDASLRRGAETANAKWSNSVAVLSGNYVLAVAFDLLREYPVQFTYDGIAVVKDMTQAAITEIEIRNKVDTTEETWKSIAMGKTGALFGMCGLAAARLSQRTDAASKAIRLGKHIGIVFQMNDDIIDITDGSGLKNRYSDISNKEPSYPLILAARDTQMREEIADAWTASEISGSVAQIIGSKVVASGAIEKTYQCMKKECEAAVDCLGDLAYTKGGKKILEWLQSNK